MSFKDMGFIHTLSDVPVDEFKKEPFKSYNIRMFNIVIAKAKLNLKARREPPPLPAGA